MIGIRAGYRSPSLEDLARLRLALPQSAQYSFIVDKLPVIPVKLAFNKPIKSTLFTWQAALHCHSATLSLRSTQIDKQRLRFITNYLFFHLTFYLFLFFIVNLNRLLHLSSLRGMKPTTMSALMTWGTILFWKFWLERLVLHVGELDGDRASHGMWLVLSIFSAWRYTVGFSQYSSSCLCLAATPDSVSVLVCVWGSAWAGCAVMYEMMLHSHTLQGCRLTKTREFRHNTFKSAYRRCCVRFRRTTDY